MAGLQWSAISRERNEDRFNKVTFVIRTILTGLKEGKRSNKRDIYYQNVKSFRDGFLIRWYSVKFMAETHGNRETPEDDILTITV